jgi:hypothetical protein
VKKVLSGIKGLISNSVAFTLWTIKPGWQYFCEGYRAASYLNPHMQDNMFDSAKLW